MRGMVGSHDIDRIVIDRLTQRRAILDRLDRRIPLDTITELGVVAVMKPQMVHADLAGYLFLAQGKMVTEQR